MTTSLLPRDVLNIGTDSGQNHYNEGIGRPGAHTDYSPQQIQDGYSSDPEFKVVIYNGVPYVQFRVRADAARTSTNTKYPRSELRAMNENATNNDSKMSFNGGSGTHWQRAKYRLMKAMTNKPWICFTQIHDASSDLCRVQLETNKIVARNTPPGSDTETVKTIQASYSMTDEIDCEIGIVSGNGYVKIAGVQVQTFPGNTTGCYEKTGCYSQAGTQSGESADDYAVVYMRDLQHFHTGWATPDPINTGGGGGGTATSQTLGVGGVSTPVGAVVATTNQPGVALNIGSGMGGTASAPKVYDGAGKTIGRITITVPYVVVQNYNVRSGNQYGIVIDADNVTVQNNDIANVLPSGDGDLNAITAWGNNIKIIYNTAINFVGGNPGDSHTDFIQTWVSSSHPKASSNWIIAFNKATGPANPSRSSSIASIHQFFMGEGLNEGGNSGGNGDPSNILISDNEIGDSWNQAIKLDGVNNVKITRNRFVGSSDHVIDNTAASTGNIFYSDNVVGAGYGDVGMSITQGTGPDSGVGGTGGTTIPVVGAGADVTVQVNVAFNRTATETNTPTSRTWKIISGPAGVGTTIANTAALSWTPTQTGTYVLRYSATNAGGTGTDDVTITVTTTGSGGGGGSGGTVVVPWTPNYPDGTAYPSWTGGGAGAGTNITSLTGTLNDNTVYNYTGSTITTAVNIDFTGKSNITIKGIVMGVGGSLTPKAGTNIILRVSAPYENTNGAATIKWVGIYTRCCIEESLFGPASPAGSPPATKNRFIQWGDSTSVGAKFGCVRRTTLRNKNGPGNPIHTVGDTAQSEGGVRYTLICNNLIQGTAPFDENDHESMLLGISSLQLTDGQQVVEFNRFENCRSEPEVISTKMNNSCIRGNVFHNCVGSVSLRHGDDGEISDNWIYGFEEETGAGSYNRTSAGPRMYGARHHIHHNTIQVNGNGGSRPSATSLFESPLTIDEGDVAPGSTSNGHANVVNVLVEKNVLAKCGNPIMVTSNYSTSPTGTIRDNIVAECANSVSDGVAIKGTSASKSGLTISGNNVQSTVAAAGLTLQSTGHYTPAAGVDRGARTPYLTATQVGQGSTYDPYSVTGTPTGPSVSAGPDASVQQNVQFVRSASENLNGATASSRAWTIVSGPSGAGTTIGTTSTLSWTPTVNGSYVIRYTMVTSAGTVTDDATIQVSATGGGTTGVPPSFVSVGAGSSGLSANVTPGVPPGIATGMFQICAIVSSGTETMVTVPADWQLLDQIAIQSPAGDPGGPGTAWVYYNTTGAGAATFVKSGSRWHHAVRAAWKDWSSLGTHLARIPGSGQGTQQHITPTVIPSNADSRIVSVVLSDQVNLPTGPFEPPLGWIERYDETKTNQTENESIAIADVIMSITTTGTWSSTNPDEAAVFAFVLEGPIVGGGGEDPVTAPIVDAGPDASVQLLASPFARAASENDTGSAITVRSWKIKSGPTGVNTVLSNGPSVNWSPTQTGTYVLTYSATNGIGTSTDDVVVTVTAAPDTGPVQKPGIRVNGFLALMRST